MAQSRLRTVAATLGRQAARRKAPAKVLPNLWLVTDPLRTPDPLDVVRELPRGSGVIYRTFGAVDAVVTARALRDLTRSRGVMLLIGADIGLAKAIEADGIHLPQRLMALAPRLKRAHPRWLITAAAHNRAAVIAGGRLGVDALLVSKIFASRSASPGAPLGIVRFAALIRGARAPVIALGGIDQTTAPRLRGVGIAGLAAVEALSGGLRT